MPSSATRLKPGTAAAVVPVATTSGVVSAPTIEGTCIRDPAFTRRTSTLPVTPVAGAAANSEVAALVLLNATPLMR